jgi:hypothetical protein
MQPTIISNVRILLTCGAYVFLAAVTLSPLLWAAVPPLVDYPNHLARMWILVHSTEIPELARNYVADWRLLPDLAMDFVVPALAITMPVELAGRIFIALTMLGLVGGTLFLHRVLHGRFSVWPVWSVLFIYNAALFWGFLTCLFAVAVYMFVFGGWIASRGWPTRYRILLFSVLGALLFLLHVFAFGLYGLSVLSYELAGRLNGRRLTAKGLASLVVISLQFLPGLLLWYASLGEVASAYTAYGNIGDKLYALFSPVNFGFFPTPFDRVLWLGVSIFLLLAARRGALKLAPGMGLPIAAMVVTAVLMPHYAHGSAYADIRLPVSLPFMILASTTFTATRKWLPPALAGLALVAFSLRIWTVSESWQYYDRLFNEFRAASTVIAPGARLLVVEPMPSGDDTTAPAPMSLPGVPVQLAKIQPMVFWQMGALAVIDRAAFFPSLFTEASPVAVTPRNREVSGWGMPVTPDDLEKSADPEQAKLVDAVRDLYGQRLYWRAWPRTFDYVLWIHLGTSPKSTYSKLRYLASGSVFDIYEIIKQ